MRRKGILFILLLFVLLSCHFVIADGSALLFSPLTPMVIKSQSNILVQTIFPSAWYLRGQEMMVSEIIGGGSFQLRVETGETINPPSQKKDLFQSEEEEERPPVEILITKKGFVPKNVTVMVNQTVIWKNTQEKLDTLVLGTREIYDMKSGYLKSGDTFSWSFPQAGKFFYVDGVVIGRAGTIEVKKDYKRRS